MKVIRSEMVKFPITTEDDMPVSDLHSFMQERGIRHLPVVDGADKLIGIVSERDVLSHAESNKLAKDIMSKNPFIVDEDASLYTVVETMANYKYGSVIVVDENHKVAGIFTTVDALRLLMRFLDQDIASDWIPSHVVTLKQVLVS
jgi:IMP dehydrogenase